MAYDKGLADLLRDDLSDLQVVEKKMFGGIAFMLKGHMLCGIHKDAAMYRVGPANHDTALAIPGVSPMMMTGKLMKGFVDCDQNALANDATRASLLALALSFVNSLPPK